MSSLHPDKLKTASRCSEICTPTGTSIIESEKEITSLIVAWRWQRVFVDTGGSHTKASLGSRVQCGGGSWGQRLCAETGFIVMQESCSRAQINSYVKWPFIFENLLGKEVMVRALCGNDIVKREGRHVCKYAAHCVALVFFFFFFILLWIQHVCTHKDTVVFSPLPPPQAETCRASSFLNMFVYKSKPRAVYVIITAQKSQQSAQGSSVLIVD